MADSKTYLTVPFAQKDAAKSLGAKWDPAKKKWYAPANSDIALFEKWHNSADLAPSASGTQKKPANKKALLGVTTYGNNKDLTTCHKEGPPWDI